MDWISTDPNGNPLSGFKLATLHDLQELECGSYWPQLHPYFRRPDYQRIRYSILGKTPGDPPSRGVSIRGASRAGELEVAFVSDHLAAKMSITGIGLSDYCLTIVAKGALAFSSGESAVQSVDPTLGLIYRGAPGTDITSTGSQERIAIWIPEASLKQRLSALLNAPASADPDFEPVFKWDRPDAHALRHLVNLLLVELQAPMPALLGSEAAHRSFSDLLIYSLLRATTHRFSSQLARQSSEATPGILRRAEAFMRAHVEDPIALHEVAVAAGCSVRSLQLTFRNFRETTPLLAIRQFRLEAARDALLTEDPGVTLTAVAHRFGFSNPGRFTRFFKAAFGESPVALISRRRAKARVHR
jgi:AraC-like DNA-binding protein